MSNTIIINVKQTITRVAIVENNILQDLYVESANKLGLVGNIYKGRVVKILPGIQAAFVDIGLEKAGFLHADDVIDTANPTIKSISSMLHEGQEIIVQVIKDPFKSKGARLSAKLTILTKDLIFTPNVKHIGISKNIEEKSERTRLKLLLALDINNIEGGYIIRRAAKNAIDFTESKNYLQETWSKIKQKALNAKCGQIIYQELALVLRIMRDFVNLETVKVIIDSDEQFLLAKNFAEKFSFNANCKFELYLREKPIFDEYNIEHEIDRALSRKVLLKSGGYLVFDNTEAMATIDVNTGAFIGKGNIEDTALHVNLEAVSVIARQLRLRSISGIIIIDFIDMLKSVNKNKVLVALEQEFRKDINSVSISKFSNIGLVAITRKRDRESLEHCLLDICSTCNGLGMMIRSDR